MVREPHRRAPVCILVKAYPQPSQRYEETVCCAGITDAGELLRLYPIPFRRLPAQCRFKRFDWVEMEFWKDRSDPRPESHKVLPESIRVLPDVRMSAPERARLWLPFVYSSLSAIHDARRNQGASLGIFKPDPESVRFLANPIGEATDADQEVTEDLYQQASLLDPEGLAPLPPPEYTFTYEFTSGGKKHRMKIHDWEVQVAYRSYRARYGDDALARLRAVYAEQMPRENLHIIVGTMHKRPYQFIIIGVLHTREDLELVAAQTSLPL